MRLSKIITCMIGTIPCMHAYIYKQSACVLNRVIIFFLYVLSFNQFYYSFWNFLTSFLLITSTYNDWSCSMYPTRICFNFHKFKILNFVAIFVSFFFFNVSLTSSVKWGTYSVWSLFIHEKMVTFKFNIHVLHFPRSVSMFWRKSEASKIIISCKMKNLMVLLISTKFV